MLKMLYISYAWYTIWEWLESRKQKNERLVSKPAKTLDQQGWAAASTSRQAELVLANEKEEMEIRAEKKRLAPTIKYRDALKDWKRALRMGDRLAEASARKCAESLRSFAGYELDNDDSWSVKVNSVPSDSREAASLIKQNLDLDVIILTKYLRNVLEKRQSGWYISKAKKSGLDCEESEESRRNSLRMIYAISGIVFAITAIIFFSHQEMINVQRFLYLLVTPKVKA